MTQLLEDVFAVEVPETFEFIKVAKDDDGDSFMGFSDGMDGLMMVKYLPEGNWQLLFTTQNMDVLGVGELCVFKNGYWGVKLESDIPAHLYKDTPKEAVEALLKYKSLSPNKNYAILRKQKNL